MTTVIVDLRPRTDEYRTLVLEGIQHMQGVTPLLGRRAVHKTMQKN